MKRSLMTLLLSSSIHNGQSSTTTMSSINHELKGQTITNMNTITKTNTITNSIQQRNLEATTTTLELQPEEIITMTFFGINPLSPDEINFFESQTQSYIQHYYNEADSGCSQCLQKSIDVTDVSIQVTEQNPPYDSGTSSSSGDSIKLYYTQKTSFTSSSSSEESPSTVTLHDIVKEPFNNIKKRKEYREEYFINATNVPEAFQNLKLTSSPTFEIQSRNFFTSIGFYAIIAASCAVLIALIGFFIFKSRKGGKDKIYDGPGMYDDEVGPSSSKNLNNKQKQLKDNEYPSQLDLNHKEDVSTIMENPQNPNGIYGNKSVGGYNTESVAEIDPMYSNLQNDQTDVSSAGGTFGDQTQKSKFSTLGSILTPGIMTNGEQSTYAEDFEAHLAKNTKGSSSSHREQILDIYAPGGKLGVVIDTPNDGAPVVHNIKDTCPIKDQLRVGDALLAVDDEDVRSMTAIKVSKLISQKSNNPKRKFTILRVMDDSA